MTLLRPSAAALAGALAVLGTGCASGPAPSAPAAGGPAKRLVLVEAKGPGPEVERFVTHFLSVASDRGLGVIADARLAGAHLADVGAPGEVSTVFRRDNPADVYLGVLLSPCTVNRHEGRYYDRQTSAAGVPVRVENVVVSYDATCAVTVTLVGEAGAAARTLDVQGRNGTADVSASNTEAEAQAADDAAERAAKKLASMLR